MFFRFIHEIGMIFDDATGMWKLAEYHLIMPGGVGGTPILVYGRGGSVVMTYVFEIFVLIRSLCYEASQSDWRSLSAE